MLGIGADGEQRVRALGAAAVVAAHGDAAVVGALDADGAGALEQLHAAAEELVLEGGGDLGVLGRQHLLAADDEGDRRSRTS